VCKIDLSRAAINYSLEFEEQSRLKTMSHQILILHYDNNETKRNCHTFHVPQSIDINFPLSGISSTHLSIYPMNKITTTCEKDQWMHDKVQELIPRLKQISPSSLFLFFFNPVELNWIELNWIEQLMIPVKNVCGSFVRWDSFNFWSSTGAANRDAVLSLDGMLSVRGQYSLSNNA